MWHYVLNISAMKLLSPSHPTQNHCDDVIMDTMASQITSLTIVYSNVYSGADQRKHQMIMMIITIKKPTWITHLQNICPDINKTRTSNPLNNTLQWRHNEHNVVFNHQPYDCLLNLYSGTDQRKHQSSASLAFVRGIHRRPVNSPHKWPVTRKMVPFDDVIIGHHLTDDTFKCIFMIENFCILIRIPLKFVPKGPKGDKSLPEPMLTQFTDAYMWH